jgi:mycothiol synthase
MLTIQPSSFSDDDYRVAVAINAAVFGGPPDPIEEWKHDDQTRDPAYPYFVDFVLRDGTVVAFVETYQNQYAYHPQKFELRIWVDPAHDAPDIRPFVLDYTLERLRDRDLIAITSGMLDSIPEALRFFEQHGFKRIAEEKVSTLDVTQFDPAQYEAQLARVREAGIAIVLLRDLQQRDPDWQRKVYDLAITVNRDIPSTGEKHYPPFEEWCNTYLTGPTFDPDTYFVALDGDTYVGYSYGNINAESAPVQFMTGVTAVRREYRRKGIATALKVHIIRLIKTRGVEEIFTTNDSQNPMYQLNLHIGFVPQPSWVRMEKALAEG